MSYHHHHHYDIKIVIIISFSHHHHHIKTVIIIMIIASSSNPSLNGGRWTQLLLQTPPSFYLMKSEWPATNLLPAIPFCICICIFCISICIFLYFQAACVLFSIVLVFQLLLLQNSLWWEGEDNNSPACSSLTGKL